MIYWGHFWSALRFNGRSAKPTFSNPCFAYSICCREFIKVECMLTLRYIELQTTNAPQSEQSRNRGIQSPKLGWINRRYGDSKTDNSQINNT